jgi:hypothetical protein
MATAPNLHLQEGIRQLAVRGVMQRELKPGDRVRVRHPDQSYQTGDKGTVLRGLTSNSADAKSYVVAMDRDGLGIMSAIFSDQDIESDE